MTIITNPDRNRLAAIAAKAGLRAIKVGMRLNSAYTPARCRQVAEQFTGKKFKARDYDGMIAAITEALEAQWPVRTEAEARAALGVDKHGLRPGDKA